MDFHGLARRQLQALCKINKIPANMTNVAMADALSALDIVEGIEELMQAQTPEKAEAGSPEVPRTVTRTSTRARKPPVTVLESGGVVPQSRSRTSRKLVGDDTVEDDKKDLTKTPAVASSRKRAPGATSRKKVEAVSVQKVYSTRRSVRLVEKQMSELCLEDSTKRTQPIKIDNELSSALAESGVKGDDFKMDISDKNEEELLVSDEVNSSEVSAQLVEAVNAACEVNGNEMLVNVATGATAYEIVEKDIYEACAEDAMGAIGNADAEKEFEIIGHCVPNVNPLEEVAQPVETEDAACENHGVLVSGKGGTDATTSENMEKEISETCAEEALGGLDTADAEKDLEIVGDGVVVETVTAKEIVTSQMDSDAVSDILVQVEVALQFSADLEKEISSDSAFDSVTKGEDSLKTSADHEKLETSENMEKEISEICAAEASEGLDIADAEKDLEIVGDGEVALQFSADLAKEISSDSAFDSVTICEDSLKTSADHEKLETSENMEKEISETCAEEASGGLDIADAEKDLEIVGDGEVVETVTAKEIVTSQMDSDVVSDILVQEEVTLQLSADLEKEISSDSAFDSVTKGEDSLKMSADHEKLEMSANQMVKMDTEAYKHETEKEVLSSMEDDATVEDPAPRSQLAVSKDENDTISQSDECDHDADSMTCQMGSPFHLSDHIEDLTDDSKPHDSVTSTVNYVEQMENMELFEDKEEMFDSIEFKSIKVEMKHDAEMLVTEQTTQLPLDASLKSKTADPEVQHLQQQSSIKDPLATQGLNKENTGSSLMSEECFKAPKTPYNEMSMRRLHKMLKEMKINTNSDKEKEANATKEVYKKTRRPRHALQTLPGNTQN